MVNPEELPTRVKSVLEDPSAQAVARVYANAFLAAADLTGVDQSLEEYQAFLDNVLDAHPRFAAILFSGIVHRDEKLALIDRAIAPHGSEVFVNFLRVLARHDRLELLPMILPQCRSLQQQRSGRRRVDVTSAHELSDEVRERIRSRLDETLPFEPILETHVDPALLGGLIIRVGDTIYDSSLRARMKQLQARLRQRSLNEIQSGRDRFSHSEGN